jgi:trimethylamine:corrinoid methyltransferase-like protein
MPLLADRQTRERWEESGGKSMVDKAYEQVEKILSEHEVDPLPGKVEEELLKIVREVEEREEKRNG